MLAHELRFRILLRLWMHVHKSFPTMLLEGLGQQVSSGSSCPRAAPFVCLSTVPSQSWFDCSLSDPWTWRFFILYHWWTWADSSGRTIFITAATLWFPTFFLNWGPSRTSICHGVTISSYLPDGEQFCSWTTKVLPIKLGHINKLSYVLCY